MGNGKREASENKVKIYAKEEEIKKLVNNYINLNIRGFNPL